MAEKDKKSSASFVPFRPLDSLFEPTVQEQPTPAKNGLTDLPVDDLYSFKDHPFRQYTEEKMAEMVESVQEQGVITPILVRPRKDGDGYEIISGHNRVELGPSFSRMFSRTPASRRAAQCCEAFKAEVSFWCYPRLAIPLSRWRAFEFCPSPITENENAIFPLFWKIYYLRQYPNQSNKHAKTEGVFWNDVKYVRQ